MKQQITIELNYEVAVGKVNINELVFRLKEIANSLMLRVLERIIRDYDDLIMERLSGRYSSTQRAGLGRHYKRGSEASEKCHCRKVLKRGYRRYPRQFSTVFGKASVPIREGECRLCGARYSPVLDALGISPYGRREVNFEQEVIGAVMDTNYRRLNNGRSLDISLGGIHNMLAGSDIGACFQGKVSGKDLQGIMADGTGVKQQHGSKGELRAVIGVTKSGSVEPLGSFTNRSWGDIEKSVRRRIKDAEQLSIPFVYDGEPGLDDFLSEVAVSQRCTWHGPRGLYHALWEDGLKKKASNPEIDKLKGVIGIELPAGEYELIREEDKADIIRHYEQSKQQLQEMIRVFSDKGYTKAVSYLTELSRRAFTYVELWLKTGIIAPKTTSLLERLFREIGRRLKRIAWGWSDKVATNLSKMIMIKFCSKEKWEHYWKEKLGIKGYFKITVESVASCQMP